MKEQLEIKGVEFLNWLVETIKQTKDVVIEKAPEVVRQLLNYSLIEKIVVASGLFLASILLLLVFNWLRKGDNDPSEGFLSFFAFIGAGGAFAGFLFNFTIILQITFTPYAYLIHQFVKQ